MMLGAHVSIAGGVETAPERAKKLTCDCMQIFSKNQQQWKAKPITIEQADLFKQNCRKFGVVETVIHDSYLINLASPDKGLLKQSRETFLDETVRAQHLGVKYLAFHPGSHSGSGESEGLRKIAESLNWVRSEFGGGDVEFLLENTAGQGSALGYSFDHLAKIISLLDDPKKAGVCLDTCHTYAAGYDLRTKNGYGRTMDLFDEIVGREYLKAAHINDCRSAFGSRVDRHEQIGKGNLGLEGFRNIMNDKRLARIPMNLETPAGDVKYKSELKLLRSLIKK